MEFRTRSKTTALNALVAKLETLPDNHPDRPNLVRMILGLRGEFETLSSGGGAQFSISQERADTMRAAVRSKEASS